MEGHADTSGPGLGRVLEFDRHPATERELTGE